MDFIIGSMEQFEKKKTIIKKAGLSSLHVVSDFDRTLTKYFIGGKKIPSTMALIREGNYLSQEYASKAFALFDRYHQVEIDENISLAEKKAKMLEWWNEHLKLLVGAGMNRTVIEDIVAEEKNFFRKGALEFLDFLSEHNVPLLVFSSGLGDIIQGLLEKHDRMSNNIHIVSNFFEFDSSNRATGYKSGIVHVFNKDEWHLSGKPYLDIVRRRKNILLLGDSIGDLRMTNGFEHNEIIRVGFLNENIVEHLELYRKSFDVVVLNDSSFAIVNALLGELAGER